MYLELLERYKQKYGFKLFSFALMPNQIDLLVELKEGATISEIMHDINSSYTKYYNSNYERKGHLFRERFKSTIIEKEPFLLNLVNYIHSRPVTLGEAREQAQYIFSSSVFYLNNISQKEVAEEIKRLINLDNEIQEVLNLIKKTYPEKNNFVDYVSVITRNEMDELYNRLHKSKIVGSNDFVERVRQQMESRKSQNLQEDEEAGPTFRPAPVFYIVILIVFAAGVFMFVKYSKDSSKEKIASGQKQEAQKETQAKEGPSLIPLVELDGTEWTIEIRPQGAAQTSFPQVDRIVFKDGKISSKYLSSKGYSTSNYGLVIQGDGRLSWETMQRNAQGDTVFLRGEANKKGEMFGSLSAQPAQGSEESLTFESLYYKRSQ